MAIFSLTANSNYSAIKNSLADGDTIRCAGFRLTVDEQPTLVDIVVDSPGTAGRCTISGAYDLSTWSFIAGTAALVDGTLPAGCTVGSATGGSVSSAHGVNINAGTVTTASGGSVNGAHGVNTNNSTVTTANGSNAHSAHGVNTNNGTVTTASGGGVNNAHGVNTNNSTVTTANGGNVGTAYGINTNNGTCLRAFNAVGRAINISRGDFKLVDGPDFRTTIDQTNDTITTIYTINGPLHPSAVIPNGVTVMELSTGGPSSQPKMRGFAY
jgi:hypothetical protein